MIRIENISKIFGGKTVLSNLSLNFESGQTHVLLGASGSGKTTLLRIIMGVLEAKSGTVWIGDSKMDPDSQRTLAQKMGYVIQDGGLFPHLTVFENVSLVAKTLKWNSEKIRSRVEALLETVGLEKTLLPLYPRQLSGGQKQRVAVMRAAFLNPEVMLLDEPLGALDPITRERLQIELKSMFSKLAKLVILVTHDISEAAFFGDTITLLYQGKVLQRGKLGTFLEKPEHPYVTEFFQAQKNLMHLDKLI